MQDIAPGLKIAGLGMIKEFASRGFELAIIALVATLLGAGIGWARSSQTTDGTRQQRMDCADDARIVCGRFIPDVDRITRCMETNKRQLSPQCRRHFR